MAIGQAQGILETPQFELDQNAIVHAYFSAMLDMEWGADIARILGRLLEIDATIRYDGQRRLDSYKDLWNDLIGIQIAEYVKRNNLSQGDLEDLIMQAYWR